MVQNANLSQSFLMAFYLFMRIGITCKYIRLFNFAYKAIDKQMIDYIDGNVFVAHQGQFFINGYYQGCYSRTDISEGIALTKSNNFPLLFFNDFNNCNDLTMWCLYISNITIITAKGVDYRCIIYKISKTETICNQY